MRILIIALSLVSISAFANDVRNTIYGIERDQQVRCDSVGKIESNCSITSIKCKRTERFRCVGSTRVLNLSLEIDAYQTLGVVAYEVVTRVNYHSKMD